MLLDQESLRFIFGLKLRGLRQEKNLSLKDLSASSGLSPSYINEIENGKKYPKSEKILLLAQSLGVAYDELISLRLKNELGRLSQFLEKNLFKGLHFDVLGIPAQTIFAMMAARPQKFSALMGTLLELTRQYNINVEDFFYATLRAYIDMHNNYFPNIEEQVEAFKKELGSAIRLEAGQLKKLLEEKFKRTVREEDFIALAPELSHLFYFYGDAAQLKLFLNKNLSEREKVFILAKELAFAYLKLKDRPLPGVTSNLDSYEPLYNNFVASYFASALLIPKDNFIAEIRLFLQNKTWDAQGFMVWAKKYPGTLESFFHRLAQILPTFFQIEQLFLIRYNYNSTKKIFSLNRELHLTELHAPHGVKNVEHYCQRWISTALLKQIAKGTVAVNVGAQRSNFFMQGQEYLCLSMAHAQELQKNEFTCSTIGFLVNEQLKKHVHFLDDPLILRKHVADTCEQCSIDDCQERAAPAIIINRQQQQAQVRAALERIMKQ